jgi:hypothetical protein
MDQDLELWPEALLRTMVAGNLLPAFQYQHEVCFLIIVGVPFDLYFA